MVEGTKSFANKCGLGCLQSCLTSGCKAPLPKRFPMMAISPPLHVCLALIKRYVCTRHHDFRGGKGLTVAGAESSGTQAMHNYW